MELPVPTPNDPPTSQRSRPTWVRLAASTLLVAMTTALARGFRPLVAPADLAMMYLAAITVIAATLGRAAALLASVLSVASYDFFCVPPYYTFMVNESHNLITFAVMFLVGLLVSGLMDRLRRTHEAANVATLRARTEEMRSSLLSSVSHDLRTPLASITGAATTLRDESDVLDPSQRHELIDTVCEEAARLDRLVRNLLDYTRIGSGAIEIRREWVPIEEIVGSALSRLEGALDARPVRVSIESAIPLVPVDPVLIEQALVNLLENAIKYTPVSSVIEIGGRKVERGVEIVVADSGAGIPPGDEDRIFEKFYRAEHRSSRGAGLGLAIVRGVALAHGGVVTARNRANGGAEFTLTIPIVGTAPASPSTEAERGDAR